MLSSVAENAIHTSWTGAISAEGFLVAAKASNNTELNYSLPNQLERSREIGYGDISGFDEALLSVLAKEVTVCTDIGTKGGHVYASERNHL